MVQFKNLALNDVTFVLCARQVPLDEFNVLVCREFRVSSGVVGRSPAIGRSPVTGRVAIIGQSHVLHFFDGEAGFSEIMLCVPHDLTAYHPICRATSLVDFRFSTVNGRFKYATQISTRWATSPDMWSTLTQIAEPYDDSVEFHFPQGDMLQTPVTTVVWRVDKSTLVVQSIHTFPGEHAVVKTKTRINWDNLV